MNWTAIVPLKSAGLRKTRLADVLDVEAREALSLRMFARVADALAGEARVIVLADRPPPGWGGDWIEDGGRGLNAELAAACFGLGEGRIAIVHADLPLVRRDDIRALFAAAEGEGIAIAPDHAETGTNALALADGRRPRFVFGPDSFARFGGLIGARHAVVRLPGLALDCDSPDDLARALEQDAGLLPAPATQRCAGE